MARKNMSPLTHEQLLAVLDYNPETGALTRRAKARRNLYRDGDAGTIGNNGRRYVAIDGRQHIAHRLIWFYVHGQWPKANLAPKDGDYLNLRLDNWIEETQAETTRRSKARSNNTTGARGVHWDKSRSKWLVNLSVDYRTKYIGRYDTKEEAVAAYEKARQEMLGATSREIADLTEKRERSVIRARVRHLWRRTLRNAGAVTGWSGFDEFLAEFGLIEWRHNREIVAVVTGQPIGPGNWKWQETLHSQFDISTKEGRNAYGRAHRQAHPMTYRDGALRKDFGIDLAAYHRILDAQGKVCAICKRPEAITRNGKAVWLAVDHCHTTGAVRGLLCKSCNNGLGHFQDVPELMEGAAAYIRRHVYNPLQPAAT